MCVRRCVCVCVHERKTRVSFQILAIRYARDDARVKEDNNEEGRAAQCRDLNLATAADQRKVMTSVFIFRNLAKVE